MNEPAGLLAFVGPDGNIWLMRPEGGAKRRLTADALPEDSYGCPRWSPDGAALAFIRNATGTVFVATAPEYRLTAIHQAPHLQTGWGPTPGLLTVASYAPGDPSCHLIVVDPMSGARELLVGLPASRSAPPPAHPTSDTLRAIEESIVWSGDGRYLAIAWPVALPGHGYLFDREQHRSRPLSVSPESSAQAPRLGSLDFGREDLLLACIEGAGPRGVALINMSGRMDLLRGAPGYAARRGPQERAIYYVGWPTNTPSLWRVPARGGIPMEILEGRLSYMAPDLYQNCLFWGLPSFAPSGTHFVVDQVQAEGRYGTDEYQAIETIWRATTEGRELRMIGMGRQAVWQPGP